MMSLTSCELVFGIPELAELVLLQLSLTDILVNVQRTSRTWHRLVNESLPIKQALFLAPIGHRPVRYVNPQAHVRGVHDDRWSETETSRPVTVLENPIITNALPGAKANGSRRTFANAALSYPRASWRRMFATQPPPARLIITRPTSKGVKLETLAADDGIRLSDLNLPLADMRSVFISGWYLWQTCSFSDECETVHRRLLRRKGS